MLTSTCNVKQVASFKIVCRYSRAVSLPKAYRRIFHLEVPFILHLLGCLWLRHFLGISAACRRQLQPCQSPRRAPMADIFLLKLSYLSQWRRPIIFQVLPVQTLIPAFTSLARRGLFHVRRPTVRDGSRGCLLHKQHAGRVSFPRSSLVLICPFLVRYLYSSPSKRYSGRPEYLRGSCHLS